MIEWTDAERQAASLIGQYEEIENTLVRNIAKRLQVDDPIGGTLEWQLQKLSDVGALTRENVEAIARMSGRTAAEVEKVISDVGLASIAKDEKIYQEALARGLLKTAAVPVDASESVKQILQAAASNATSYLNLVNTTAVASAQQAFIQAVDQAYLEVSAGIYDYQSSIRRQVKKLAEAGITGVQYKRKDGTTVNYPMDAAVRRAVLTSTSQAANRLQLQRASDYGAEYVEVSSHITARPSHAEWQGRVYKLNGAEKGFPNFYEATHYGDADGLGGINCRHSFYPFFKGISEKTYPHYDEEECRKAYEESQVQRSYENQIRALKREAVAADAMGDKETFDKVSSKLKAKQGELNDFMDATGRRQPLRTGIVKTDATGGVGDGLTPPNGGGIIKKHQSFDTAESAFGKVRMTGIAPEYADEIKQTLVGLANDYPIGTQQMTVTAQQNRGVFGYYQGGLTRDKKTGVVQYGADIHLSNANMPNKAASARAHAYTYRTRGSPITSDLATIPHEYAHAIDGAYVLKRDTQLASEIAARVGTRCASYAEASAASALNMRLYASQERLSHRVASEMASRRGVTVKEFLGGDVKKHLGTYAATDEGEFLAEGFAAYRTIPVAQQSDFVREFGQLFDELFYREAW